MLRLALSPQFMVRPHIRYNLDREACLLPCRGEWLECDQHWCTARGSQTWAQAKLDFLQSRQESKIMPSMIVMEGTSDAVITTSLMIAIHPEHLDAGKLHQELAP